MEQLGCLLLGFAVAAPAVFVIREIVTAREELRRPGAGIAPAGRQGMAPLSRCDPQAAADYFGSWLYRPKTDSAQPLSVAELTALLGGTTRYGSPAIARFDSEGGYRLRL